MKYGIYHRKTARTKKFWLAVICFSEKLSKTHAAALAKQNAWHEWAVVPFNDTLPSSSIVESLSASEVNAAKLP